jgi:hypothetical protein
MFLGPRDLQKALTPLVKAWKHVDLRLTHTEFISTLNADLSYPATCPGVCVLIVLAGCKADLEQ